MVVAGESTAEEAGGVVTNSSLHDPRALDDPVDDLEPSVAERVVAMDEAVEKRSRWDRVFGSEVEDGGVRFTARNLEIDGDDEGFHGFAFGLGAAEGGHHAIVRAAKDVVETRWRAEPVDTGGFEKPVAGGALLAAREVVWSP